MRESTRDDLWEDTLAPQFDDRAHGRARTVEYRLTTEDVVVADDVAMSGRSQHVLSPAAEWSTDRILPLPWPHAPCDQAPGHQLFSPRPGMRLAPMRRRTNETDRLTTGVLTCRHDSEMRPRRGRRGLVPTMCGTIVTI